MATTLIVCVINYYFIKFVLIVQLSIWYLPTSKIKNISTSALAAPLYYNSSLSFKLRIRREISLKLYTSYQSEV